MTINEISEKALAKAGEILDNTGHWDGPSSTKASAEAVQTLVAIGLASAPAPAPKEKVEPKTTGK